MAPSMSLGWPEPRVMYVSLASRNRIMTEPAKAAASGVVARPSPRRRADDAPLGALARLVGEAPRQGRQRERAHLLRLRGELREVQRIRRAACAAVEDDVPEGGQAP